MAEPDRFSMSRCQSPTVRHVVLVTYGEPPTSSFREQLAYSWRILLGLTRTIAPIPKPALPFIALARAHARCQLWRQWGYLSPLEAITREQAGALQRALADASPGGAWSTHYAYEFRRPRLVDVLDTIPASDPVWVAPMYVVDSAFTHELSRRVVVDASVRGLRPRVCALPPIDAESLAQIAAEHVLRHLEARFKGPEAALVLAAHGTPLDPPRPIETGRAATERVSDLIRARLAPCFGMVAHAWLNHTRGGRWTEPPIDKTLRRVREGGFTKVAYFPYGFLADNAESQLEGRIALAGEPTLEARTVPCLNEAPSLARALAAQILAA